MDDRDFYTWLVRLHILHHAFEEPIYGAWISAGLAGHVYRLSAVTLYPLLHRLVKKGYLRSTTEREGKPSRKMYRATSAGRKALKVAKIRVRELFGELFEEGAGPSLSSKKRK
jgi:DNA-binding PadR family transcriptional regulator